MKFADLKTKVKILLGVGAPLSLLVILGATSLYSINKISSTNKSVNHTHEVLGDAAAIVSSAVDMETGMRGYLLSGKENFLIPYKGGETAAYKGIDDLSKTVSDNPPQVARLKEVKKVLLEWQKDVTTPTIELRRNIGDAKTMNDLAAIVKEARGKEFFDKFREQITLFDSREQKLLAERSEEFHVAVVAVNENLELLHKTAGWVNHTNKVLTSASSLLSHAVNMETGIRGYLLAGKGEFLDPYNSGRSNFKTEAKALQSLVSDNPQQVARLKKAEQLISDWQKNVTEPAIALRKKVNIGQHQLQDIEAMVGRKEGKKYFDAFRKVLAEFSDIEAKLLIEREESAGKAENRIKDDLVAMDKNEKQVTHTYKVLGVSNEILGSAVNMETGMRGYLLAGEEAFLDPYNAGVNSFAANVNSLSKTVSDNPAQVELLGQIRNTINDWRGKVVEPTIDLRRKIGNAKTMDDMADLIGEARGKKYFDQFRGLMAKFQSIEQDLMKKRSAESVSTNDLTQLIIMGCILGGLIIGGGIAWYIGNIISGPISRMTSAMQSLANGELETEVPATEQKDEIGEMAGAVQVFKDNAIRNKEMEDEQAEQKKLAEEREKAAQEEAIASERQMVGEVFGKAMSAVAAKDLGYRITDELPSAYLVLRDDFNNAIDQLASTINQIGVSSAQILAGSSEIHDAASNLSKRTEQQAVAVEETAAALEETTTAMKTSTESAKDAGTLVSTTKNNAEHSGGVVQNAIVAMGKIETSSEEIANIIGVIDDIAFQTNLLALNAGVEAARAGESGKGFAVVAQEVRELAQRSASAAKEIKQLITTSGEEVKNGAELVNETGKALESIVAEVTDINEHVAAIVSAANEQSAGLQEINQSVNNIDQGTQHNASVAEQSTAASHTLSEEVTKINEMLNEFNTGNSNTGGSKMKSLPEEASNQNTPQPSPARALTHKVAKSFGGAGAATAAAEDESWEEF
ncbi:MAG: HAMP domain-containing protein [Gammaproteobacteria bacterium]|nr:HAMP domain-containing protein [Gammaproteobacteria bacterium]